MRIIFNGDAKTLCPACREVIDLTAADLDLNKSISIKCKCGELLFVILTYTLMTKDFIITNMAQCIRAAQSEHELHENRAAEVKETLQGN